MAFTFPLPFPSALENEIRSVAIEPLSIVSQTASEFSAAQQIQVHPGQLWRMNVQLASQKRPTAELFNAFRLRLNNQEGTFLLGDPAAAIPRGTAASTPGTPIVSGVDQIGDTLTFSGGPNSETGWLLEGDYISLGTGEVTRLHKILEDLDTSGTGTGLMKIWPSLRESPNDLSPIIVQSAKGTWRLAGDTAGWAVSVALFYTLSFKAVEAL